MLNSKAWHRLSALALLGASPVLAQGVPQGGIMLQPHRIAYEVSLDARRSGSAFAEARGLIAIEFTGNPCVGYTTNFRQVTDFSDNEGKPRNLDFKINHWEDGKDASLFRFTVRNSINGTVLREADGEARKRDDGSLSVVMNRPRGQKSDFDGNIAFPAAMTLEMITAAFAGQKQFQRKVFDGSEGAEKLYDTIASIGAPLLGAKNNRIELVLRSPALDAVPRWPISIAYFEDEPGDKVPVYTLRSVTFANGVLGDLAFDFPDFSLIARATRYEPLPQEACRK